MKNRIYRALFVAGAVMSASLAQAENFSVEIEVNSATGTIPLIVQESAAFTFPIINIDESSTEGSSCFADGSRKNIYVDGFSSRGTHTTATSICAGETVAPAGIRITGAPNALLTMTRSVPSQTQSGFEFTGTDDVTNPRLDTAGVHNTTVASTLILRDKAAVTSGLLSFSYDVTAAYQ